ncbi:Hsp70 family protein [Leptolyngbya sp. FACHB-671]|uniref:Hsp70 family protein n=1 Tax=Leptolyngbya sp. FACHB-671 TaxID=2692812 RepID=UPI001683D4D4|nr:Hsp70 family protein [Leptolyngbya sp. FACHB-671]
MIAIAVDFGTSNTVVSILEPDTQTPKSLRFSGISRLFRLRTSKGDQEIPVVPTLVFVKSQEQWVVGEQVRSQRLGLTQPGRLFKAFKRDLAADFQPPPRQIDGVSYSATAVSEQFLQQIWQQILHQIQPDQVIFTVPVGAFERYLGWFREVGSRLGAAEVHLVDESTAAALGYAVQRPGSLVLVIDFGGGTLDLSLVRTAATQGDAIAGKEQAAIRAEVLAKSDAYVGGEDIDQWIVEDYLRQVGSSRQLIGEVGWQNLLAIAERLKIRLSGTEVAKESWLDEESFTSYELQLSRSQLEEILEVRQFLEQLRQALDETLAIALSKGIAKSDIEQVLLVGGSCLIPAVQQLIVSYFGRQRVKMDKPFEAVAHGALALSQLSSIEDYLRHSYAIRLWEPYSKTYSYFSLFAQGAKYPCQRPEPLTLQVAIDGQREIRLDIGEVAEVAQAEVAYDAQGRMTSAPLRKQETYRSLDTQHDQVCVAHLNPPGQVGIDRVSVQFEVNEQRVLVATVEDLLTGKVLVNKGAIAKLQ